MSGEAGKTASYYLERKCWRKKSYRTMTAARKAAKQIEKKKGYRLYPYQCTGCGQAHLTHLRSGKGLTL